MKNVIIIGTHPNTAERESMLFDCITQLKKTGNDILLVTNYASISDRVLKLCNLVVYTDDNLFLPEEESPSVWFADYVDFIEVFGKGVHYIVTKKMRLAMDLANTMGYDNFIFLEYDTIISDEDLPQIEKLFSMTKKKKAVFFKFCNDNFPIGEYNPLGYLTLFFAGNVSFFCKEVRFPATYEEWLGNPIWALGHKVLEYKFKSIFDVWANDIEVLDNKITTFFPSSKIDISTQPIPKDVHIIQNLDNPLRPLLLMVGGVNSNTVVKLNDKLIFNDTVPYGTLPTWHSVYFDLVDESRIEIFSSGAVTAYTITKENIALHSTGVRRNI